MTATTWADAELIASGEQQARKVAEVCSYLGGGTITAIPSSPLRRCLRTTQLALPPEAGNPRPMIKEKLCERLGAHTCDQRSRRSWIAEHCPSFDIEPGFVEEDVLWSPDRRETVEEHTVRSTELLDEIFDGDYGRLHCVGSALGCGHVLVRGDRLEGDTRGGRSGTSSTGVG